MGTPWQGTPVMIEIADLTKFFGLGCGYNEDLSLQGASRWLNKIPLEQQKEVYYYTTSGDVSYKLLSNYCIAINYRRDHVKLWLRLCCNWMVPMMEC